MCKKKIVKAMRPGKRCVLRSVFPLYSTVAVSQLGVNPGQPDPFGQKGVWNFQALTNSTLNWDWRVLDTFFWASGNFDFIHAEIEDSSSYRVGTTTSPMPASEPTKRFVKTLSRWRRSFDAGRRSPYTQGDLRSRLERPSRPEPRRRCLLGRKRSWRCWACTAALLLCVTLPALGAEWNGSAGPGPLSQLSVQELSDQAAQAESIKEWSSASELWYQLLLRDRTNSGVRERYRFCLRRAQQVNRFHDESYRQQIVSLSLDAAIQVYGEVLAELHTDYVEQDKVRLPLLFKHGLEELQFALEEAFFCQTFAQELPSDVIRAFGQELQNWAKKSVKRPADAQGIARDIALAAQKTLGLKPSLVVLELACGACVRL